MAAARVGVDWIEVWLRWLASLLVASVAYLVLLFFFKLRFLALSLAGGYLGLISN